MKIGLLDFLTYFYIGGPERQAMNLATRIDPERFDLHMGCLGKVGPLLREAEESSIPVSEYRIDSLYDFASLQARIRFGRYLREHSIDLVHSYGFYSNLFAIPAARLAGVPRGVPAHPDFGPGPPPPPKPPPKPFLPPPPPFFSTP